MGNRFRRTRKREVQYISLESMFKYVIFCKNVSPNIYSNCFVLQREPRFCETAQACDGDIESNPGPTYSILKAVKASYHQGNVRFGCTAGNQCACNSLFALAWSIYEKLN